MKTNKVLQGKLEKIKHAKLKQAYLKLVEAKESSRRPKLLKGI